MLIFILWIARGIIWNKSHPEINYGDNWFLFILANWFWLLVKTWSIVITIYIISLSLF